MDEKSVSFFNKNCPQVQFAEAVWPDHTCSNVSPAERAVITRASPLRIDHDSQEWRIEAFREIGSSRAEVDIVVGVQHDS